MKTQVKAHIKTRNFVHLHMEQLCKPKTFKDRKREFKAGFLKHKRQYQ